MFNKNKKEDKKDKEVKTDDVQDTQASDAIKDKEPIKKSSDHIVISDDSNIHTILKGFYISEKASMAQGLNQYVFKVFKSANKPEIRKHISRHFNVEVENVNILNMPRKRRDLGKHPGFKSGFKKAVVTLKKGYSIDQAQA
jgi:large subunit ribosomal protein L23